MSVLRESRDSLVAMLEAFVYDPLISWRLVDLGEEKENTDRTSLDADELELKSNGEGAGVTPLHTAGVPIDMGGSISNLLNEPITEDPNEEDTDDENRDQFLPGDSRAIVPASYSHPPIARSSGASSARARSIQMYSNIQTWAANLSSDARIASITGSERPDKIAAEGSIARSRMERSIRQREMMSILEKEGEAAHEEALNEKALKVIRRVQDKLTGTDFPDSNGESLDVVDQVQRLVVQATSTENLCQLFIGWCAFW
jgi:phosphatidylinositol kinase/protein kinase (PI-3  family)